MFDSKAQRYSNFLTSDGRAVTRSAGLSSAARLQSPELAPKLSVFKHKMQARTPISCSLEYEDDFYKRVDFGKIDYDKDVLVEKVKSGLNSYGLVVVDNISLTPSEYVAFTASFGEPINLPKFLVPAKIEGHPEIARVANFDLSSEEVNPKYSFGFYWHHDGNFWEEGRHHIINLLHSHIVPEEGGMTGFLNTKKAYAALESTVKEDIAERHNFNLRRSCHSYRLQEH